MKRFSSLVLGVALFTGITLATPNAALAQYSGDCSGDPLAEFLGELEEAASAGWTPLFYDGYLVFFDVNGVPYYYLDGKPVFVPQMWEGYSAAVVQYRTHAPRYRAFHQRFEAPRYRVRVRQVARPTVVVHRPRVVQPRVVVHRPTVVHRPAPRPAVVRAPSRPRVVSTPVSRPRHQPVRNTAPARPRHGRR